jgi:hypothetical protein
MNKLPKVYAPMLTFAENVIDNANQIFSNKAFVRIDLLTREIELFKKALQNDLAGHLTEFQKASSILTTIEQMNTPHLLVRNSAWVNIDMLAKKLDEIQALIPKELLIPIDEFQSQQQTPKM